LIRYVNLQNISKNIYESNREILRYNECIPFLCVGHPVELLAMGLLSVENFSETKLG